VGSDGREHSDASSITLRTTVNGLADALLASPQQDSKSMPLLELSEL